jgi:hypothetical protein
VRQDGGVPAPRPEDLGLFTVDPGLLAANTALAWHALVEVLEEIDLAAPSRAKRPTRDVVIGIGRWPDSRGIAELLADARSGRTEGEPFAAASRRLAAAHAGASDEEVRDAVRRSAAETIEWLGSADYQACGALPTPSPLGLLPVATTVHAAVYEVAMIARDLVVAGARPRPELDDLGLVALLDATGGVGARLQLRAAAAAVAERTSVATEMLAGGWRTTVPADRDSPAVRGPAGVLLDLAGGRADWSTIRSQVQLQDTRGMLALAPVVEGIPDLPGGPLLRRVARLARLLGGFR